MKPRAKSLIMANKHASQRAGRRGLDLGKQERWIVVSSVCSSLELAVTNAGRSRAAAVWHGGSREQGQLCGLRCLKW